MNKYQLYTLLKKHKTILQIVSLIVLVVFATTATSYLILKNTGNQNKSEQTSTAPGNLNIPLNPTDEQLQTLAHSSNNEQNQNTNSGDASNNNTGNTNNNQTKYTAPKANKPTNTSTAESTQPPKSTAQAITCNENLKSIYITQYNSDVTYENSYHESELNRIAQSYAARGIYDSSYRVQAQAPENSRHDAALVSLESALKIKLIGIYCL